MSLVARYTALTVPGSSQLERVKLDNNYFRACLGGFNMDNASGEHYPLVDSVKQLFEEGGIIRRRLNAGLLRGEYGHPKIAGMPLPTALQRLAKVDPLTVSHHFRAIELIPHKDEYGKDVILTMGEVAPSGPYGPTILPQLENPDENVAFSIRSFTNNVMMGGKLAKIVQDALTWDFVTEPGIKFATKFVTAGLEELIDSFAFTEADLNLAIGNVAISGLESDFTTLRMVKTSLGWTKVAVIDLRAIDWGIKKL